MTNAVTYNSNINFGTNYTWSKKGWFKKTNLNHHTNFERPDIDWDFTCEQIKQNLPNGKILCHACSDGSEAVTLALKLGKEYIINAFDISKKIFRQAKKGLFFISTEGTDQNFFDKYGQFFTKKNGFTSLGYNEKLKDYEFAYKHALDKNILKNIVFKKRDITKAFTKKQEEPCAVFIRNCWYLLKNDEARIKLAKDMYENFQPKSMVIIGGSDTSHLYDDKLSCHIDELLQAIGFKAIKKDNNITNNIFTRPLPTQIFIKE